MKLCMRGHSYRYELENICRLFLPQESVLVCETLPDRTGVCAVTVLEKNADITCLTVELSLDTFCRTKTAEIANDTPDWEDACELELATLLYHLFTELFGVTQRWGIVTGVRPVKLLRRLKSEYGNEEKALDYMRECLLVSDSKLALCRNTLQAEDRILSLSRPDSFSLYISIPFCPTRCDYCSFVSRSIANAQKLVAPYVERLAEEIAHTGKLARELGLRLETVYFGGGTPTSLSAEQLAFLLKTVEQHFGLSTVREYTVEAGRPDTVTADKLRAIKAAGVNRISINPQTLQDEVLKAIGRRHTVAQFYDAFELARQCGHDNINTDLIAGLPQDTLDGFMQTLDGILALQPENITVHTLSMKRASNLVVQHRADYEAQEDAVAMVEATARQLPENGYHSYYLYRQSRMVGNQENVGWAKDGFDGLYNVYIMDETHTILGCGAGAVTKLKLPGTDYLERVFNFKFPYEYNDNLPEMLRRKEQVREFYSRYVFGGETPVGRRGIAPREEN